MKFVDAILTFSCYTCIKGEKQMSRTKQYSISLSDDEVRTLLKLLFKSRATMPQEMTRKWIIPEAGILRGIPDECAVYMYEEEDENNTFIHRYCDMIRTRSATTKEEEEKLMHKIEKSLSRYDDRSIKH